MPLCPEILQNPQRQDHFLCNLSATMEVRELTLIQLLTCTSELCSLIVSKLIFMVQECPGLMSHSLVTSLQSPWVWSISLCVSWHWHFARIRASYFVESPSVWVCLRLSAVSILVVVWYCQKCHRNDDAFFSAHHLRGKGHWLVHSRWPLLKWCVPHFSAVKLFFFYVISNCFCGGDTFRL